MSERTSPPKSPQSYLPLTPPLFHVLMALADGDKHGYAIMKENSRTASSYRMPPLRGFEISGGGVASFLGFVDHRGRPGPGYLMPPADGLRSFELSFRSIPHFQCRWQPKSVVNFWPAQYTCRGN